jgi:hypothetical protein
MSLTTQGRVLVPSVAVSASLPRRNLGIASADRAPTGLDSVEIGLEIEGRFGIEITDAEVAWCTDR